MAKYRGSSPLARWRAFRRSGGRVSGGPFAGLEYPAYSTGSEYFPKLLGTYEMELHGVLQEIPRHGFSSVAVVGAGEGYYVGGMAKLLPETPLTCYEGDPYGRTAIGEMCERNGFSERVDVRGYCEAEELAGILGNSPSPLLVMDVEGGERQLLDPMVVPALERTMILVEVHDCFEPDLADLLKERFRGTHTLEEIVARPRTLGDAAPAARLVSLPPASVLPLLDEKRPDGMRWYYLVPVRAEEMQ